MVDGFKLRIALAVLGFLFVLGGLAHYEFKTKNSNIEKFGVELLGQRFSTFYQGEATL